MKVKEQAASYRVRAKRYTYQDYLDLPDDGKRYEVIHGELVMTPAPYTFHQIVSGNLEYELRTFVKKEKSGKVFYAPVDVLLSENNVLQPDILFISKERSNIITEKNIAGAPDLIIEIISPSSAYYDLLEKKEIYEKFGVQEYWIVDPKKQRVEIYVNHDNQFELNQRLDSKGTLKSRVLAGFEMSVEQIFCSD